MQPPITISIEPLELKLKHPFTISRSSSTTRQNWLVRARWGDHEGLGEASYTPRYSQDARIVGGDLARAVASVSGVERSPEAVRALIAKLGLCSGASMGLSIALADVEAQARGIPIHALYGLPPPPPVITSFTIGLDTREIMVQKVHEAAEFPVLKVKAGRADDVDLVRAVREAHAGPLWVDANEGWSPEEAPARIVEMARLGVEFVEQPVKAGQLDVLARLKRESPLPLIADEDLVSGAELESLAGLVDGVNVKLMKCGGLDVAVDIMRRARALGMKVMVGCMIESTVGITAAAHLLALVDYADLDGHILISNDPYSGVVVREGRLVMPTGRIGLGVVPAETRSA